MGESIVICRFLTALGGSWVPLIPVLFKGQLYPYFTFFRSFWFPVDAFHWLNPAGSQSIRKLLIHSVLISLPEHKAGWKKKENKFEEETKRYSAHEWTLVRVQLHTMTTILSYVAFWFSLKLIMCFFFYQ